MANGKHTKPRPDSLKSALLKEGNDAFSRACSAMISGNMTYAELVVWFKNEFEIKTSISALRRFWTSTVEPDLAELQKNAGKLAEIIIAHNDSDGGESMTGAAISMVKKRALELLVDANADPQERHATVRQLLTIRSQDLEAEKLKASLMTKLEAGIAALWDEVKGNAAAEKLVRELEGILSEA